MISCLVAQSCGALFWSTAFVALHLWKIYFSLYDSSRIIDLAIHHFSARWNLKWWSLIFIFFKLLKIAFAVILALTASSYRAIIFLLIFLIFNLLDSLEQWTHAFSSNTLINLLWSKFIQILKLETPGSIRLASLSSWVCIASKLRIFDKRLSNLSHVWRWVKLLGFVEFIPCLCLFFQSLPS